MKPERITGTPPKSKRRAGVMPTRRERDRKNDYRRQDKHRRDQEAAFAGMWLSHQ